MTVVKLVEPALFVEVEFCCHREEAAFVTASNAAAAAAHPCRGLEGGKSFFRLVLAFPDCQQLEVTSRGSSGKSALGSGGFCVRSAVFRRVGPNLLCAPNITPIVAPVSPPNISTWKQVGFVCLDVAQAFCLANEATSACHVQTRHPMTR